LSAALLLWSALLASPETPAVPVRTGAAIELDGRIGSDEWKDALDVAADHPHGGKARLLLKRTGPWLAVGLSAETPYAGEVFWLHVRDRSRAWANHLMFSLGQPAAPPLLWRREAAGVEADASEPGECPRACRARVRVAGLDGWSAEYLVRVPALGIGRGDLREFFGLATLVLLEDRERIRVVTLPAGGDPQQPASFGRLVSPDGWGARERWAPVGTEVSREFDDHAMLHRLFLEHEAVSLRHAPELVAISNAVRPRSETRIALLRRALEQGRRRNPTLPAWRYFLGRLLHEANLFDEARPLVEGIPEPLRGLDPFVNLRAEHYFDTERWQAAIDVCLEHPRARGVRETLELAHRGQLAWAAELRAIARDKAKQNPNPRIRLVTRKGNIDIELFEDDAPGAVRNFVDLVWRKKFYDGLRFHDVTGGTWVRVGDPSTRPGSSVRGDGPPWRLRADDSPRRLLRGYVGTVPVEGGVFHGSQFFIAVAPLLKEERKTQVFGRVLAGLDVLGKLDETDTLLEVQVLFKRNHGYDPLPVRIEG